MCCVTVRLVMEMGGLVRGLHSAVRCMLRFGFGCASSVRCGSSVGSDFSTRACIGHRALKHIALDKTAAMAFFCFVSFSPNCETAGAASSGSKVQRPFPIA